MRSKKILSAAATLALLATWVMPAAALSTVTNSVNQDTTGFIINGGFQEADLMDNAFQNATGSIGVNNAAGSLNQQANQLYIDQTATELTLSGVNTQDQTDSTVDLTGSNGNFYSSGNNKATYENNAFQNAHGNIGANNAGGNLNQQQNTATILSSCNNQCGNGPELTGGDIPQISLDQTTGNLFIDGSSGPIGGITTGSDGNNLATYDNNAFAGASGNIGANNAAGNMNQQGNQLVLLTNGEMENLQVALSQDNSEAFSTFNSVANDTNNVANFDGSAFSTASGNIGVNNAAGDMNQQANQAVLNVPASPAPTATEPPEGNDPIAPTTLMLDQTSTGEITNAGNQTATFEGNAFQTVTGNVGVNNAAGTLNQQQNQLYLDTHAEDIALTIANSQSQDGVTVDPSGDQGLSAGNNAATFKDDVFQNASGNIGANNAAGNANQQQNGAAIFSNTCVTSCGGAAELENGAQGTTISISQESGAGINDQGNVYLGVADITSEPANGANNAIFEDNAFQAATGNVGANNAAGNMNQQGNELVLVTNGELEGVTLSVDQLSEGNSVNHDTGNVANFDGHAFANASGNVGVNNAAGDLNQQSNLAVMNVASTTPTTSKVSEGADAFEPVQNNYSQSLFDIEVYDAGNQTAAFKGGAFSNATGNIGVNNAAGTQNQQSNALYVDQLAENVNLSVSNAQALEGVFMDSGDASGNNQATFQDNVFSNASGNIGVNNAAGNANQQQNSATILSNVCGDPACGQSLNVNGGDSLDNTGSLSIDQFAFLNAYDGSGGPTPGESEGNEQATFENNAFQNAKGNIGANNAAGNMNQQSNQMVLITNATLSSLSAHIAQSTVFNGITNDTGNIAAFQGNAFQNASGNVSANNAAGDLNQQANQTIINTKP